MRFTHFFFTLALALFFLAACQSASNDSPAASETPAAPRLQVTVGEALAFAAPSRDSAIMFRLIEGDTRPILAKTEADLIGVVWYQVNQGEEFGWVAGSQVQVSGPVELVRTVGSTIWTPAPTLVAVIQSETPSPSPSPTPIPQAQAGSTGAPLYDAPDINSPQRGQLRANEAAQIVGQAENLNFYLLGREAAILGWVEADKISLVGDLGGVPLVEQADTPLSTLLAQVPSATPSPPASPLPSLPPTATPRFSPSPPPDLNLAGTALAAPTATLPPTAGPSPSPTVASIQRGDYPPLSLALPPTWQQTHILIPLSGDYLEGELPTSIYRGPLSDGSTGTLWLLWGFPNLMSPTGVINLYADAVQLLRSVIFDANSCTIGLGDEKREYQVGPYTGVGTIYSAVNCQGEADIAGFFTIVQVGGGNFAFYAGIEPPASVGTGIPEMQALLQSVQFDDNISTITPSP